MGSQAYYDASSAAMSVFASAMPHQYAFTQAQGSIRQQPVHGTSSAFSSSANPDEDWTKISDLAERRRIQNRIAQRNYRKKLKRRLEDLERRAASPEEAAAQEQPQKTTTAAAKTASKKKSPSKSQQKSPQSSQQAAPKQSQSPAPPMKAMSQLQFTPPMEDSDHLLFTATGYDDVGSQTPPMFAYSNYPPPEEMALPPYGTPDQYTPMTTTADGYPSYLGATAPVASTTHFADAMKRDSYSMDNGLGSYMNFTFLPGPYDYDQSNPHTPPLSHSFDQSPNCSDAGFEHPTTPMSLPGSPGLAQAIYQ